jgi:hypothetical protein
MRGRKEEKKSNIERKKRKEVEKDRNRSNVSFHNFPVYHC